MSQASTFNRFDVHVLLRIAGSRTGADAASILAFEKSHHHDGTSMDMVQQSIARLLEAGHIVQQGEKYVSSGSLQKSFLSECRNCRDTVEEFDVLSRILGKP